MGFFKKRSRRSIDDPDFGRITEGKTGSWDGDEFKLWGHTSIQVMIEAGTEEPSDEQRAFARSLRADDKIQARIEQAVAVYAKETTHKMGRLLVSSIYIPKSPPSQTWRIWFDMEGEEHYWYGAEVEGWHRIDPFAED